MIMSENKIIFQHVGEPAIQYHFVASDQEFKILSINDIEVVNAYTFMDKMKWFIDSKFFKRVKS